MACETWVDGRMDGWMDGYNFIIAHGDSTLRVWRVIHGWMDGWMDGYNFIIAHGDSTLSVWRVVTWVDGRMDGWI